MDTSDTSLNKGASTVPEGCDDYNVEALHEGVAEAEKGAPLTFPAWLVVLFAISAFLAGSYFISLGGGGAGDKAAAAPEGPKTPIQLGEIVYKKNCAACHQSSGLGSAGQYPPLAGSEYVIHGNKRPILILLYGMHGPVKVKGNTYNGNMQAWEKSLSQEQIANVVTYIRGSWGNTASPVTEEQVAAVAGEIPSRGQFTEAEILAVPEDANAP
jgi:mono/diheme cytochrome c family protein